MKDYSVLLNKAFLELRTLIPFLMVGGFTTVVYFALFTIFYKFMHINYKVAVSGAFIGGAAVQFFLNRNLTFKSRHRNVVWQIVKYISMITINYCITLFIVKSMVEILLLSPYIGSVISIGVTVFTGYLMGKFWVFKTHTNKVEEI